MYSLQEIYEDFCYRKDLLLNESKKESKSARKQRRRVEHLGFPKHEQPSTLFNKLTSSGKVQNDPGSRNIMSQYGRVFDRPDLGPYIASGNIYADPTTGKLTGPQRDSINAAMGRRKAKEDNGIGYAHNVTNSTAINPPTIKSRHMTLRGEERSGLSTDIDRLHAPRQQYIIDKNNEYYVPGHPKVDEKGAGKEYFRQFKDPYWA